eukprot:2906143-Prymnesium_polylepis.1
MRWTLPTTSVARRVGRQAGRWHQRNATVLQNWGNLAARAQARTARKGTAAGLTTSVALARRAAVQQPSPTGSSQTTCSGVTA